MRSIFKTLWRFLPRHLKYVQARHIWDGTDLFQYLCIPNISVSISLHRKYFWTISYIWLGSVEFIASRTRIFGTGSKNHIFNTEKVLAARKKVFWIAWILFVKISFRLLHNYQFRCFQFYRKNRLLLLFQDDGGEDDSGEGWWWWRSVGEDEF